MAILIEIGKPAKVVEPENGTDFQVDEVCELIGCNILKVVSLGDDSIMIIDKDEKALICKKSEIL